MTACQTMRYSPLPKILMVAYGLPLIMANYVTTKTGAFITNQIRPFLRLGKKLEYITYVTMCRDSSVTVNFYDDKILLNISGTRCQLMDLNIPALHRFGNITYKEKRSPSEYELITDSANIVVDTLLRIIRVQKRNVSFEPVLIGSQSGRYFYNADSIYNEDRIAIHPLKKSIGRDNILHSYYSDGKNSFLGTNHGLYLNDSIAILQDCEVTSVTRDIGGNYWISTLRNGVYCLKSDFMTTAMSNNVYKGIARYLYANAHMLFFSTSGNDLFLYKNGHVKPLFEYKKFKKNGGPALADVGYLIEKNGLAYNYYNLYNNDNIAVHDILAKHPETYRTNNPFFSLSVKRMFAVNSEMYIQGRQSIAVADFKDDKITNSIKRRYSPDSWGAGRIFGMTKMPDNSMYYSTRYHVFKIENGTSTPQTQFKDLAFKAMCNVSGYILGITLLDNRLIICDMQHKKMTIDTVAGQNCVWGNFFRLNDSMVIIATDNFHRLFTVHHFKAGIKRSMTVVENPFVPLLVEAIASDDSDCYFLKEGNITKLNLRDLFARPGPPQLFFKDLKAGKKAYEVGTNVTISYKEAKNIRLSFSTLSFSGRDIDYQYSFTKNEQDNWIDIKGEEITLVNPGYGTYTVKIRARTMASSFSVPSTFTLYISKPFWATFWFKILLLIAFLGLAASLTRYRVLYLLHKKEKLHADEIKFLKSEYKVLNALMNPHFIFNTLNNVQGLINKDEKRAANKYLGIFANLIRQNMQNISMEMISLQKEMDVVINYLELEKLRFKELLNYEINIDTAIDLSEVMVPPLLIQPLVENSIKHGIFAGKSTESIIRIEIFEENDLLTIAIKDNGLGIVATQAKPGSTHKSYGLENIQKRIAQLSAIQDKQISLQISDVKDDDGMLQWTVVSITISIS